MNQAIRPNFLNVPSMVQEKKASGKATDEEIALASMANTSGWTALSDFAHSLMNELDNVQSAAISNGLSREEIGENAIVIDMTKKIINRILTKVSDSKETVEKLNE